jgi:hypothetical protein
MSSRTRSESEQRVTKEASGGAGVNANGARSVVGGERNDRNSVIRSATDFLPAQIVLLIPIFLFTGRDAGGQGPSRSQDLTEVRAVDGDGKPYPVPPPPEAIAKLIRQGNVSFEFYDPKIEPRSFAGETKFEFRYAYQSRSNWQRITQDGKAAIEVKVEYQDITLERSHRVLLPQDLLADDLFTRRLTLHEFDHVRISCDPRLPGLLKAMLIDRNAKIVQVLDENEHEFVGKPSAKDLARIGKQIVKDESDKVFNDFVSVVSIRYQELDRISNYGLKPLTPEDRDRIIEAPPQPPKSEPDEANEPLVELGPTETVK